MIRRFVLFLAFGLGALVLLAACSDEAQDQIRDAIEEGGGELPPDEGGGEAPPDETPPAEAPPAEDDGVDDGLSDEDWLVIVLLGVAGIAIILVATSLASNHSQSKQAQQSSVNRSVNDVVGGSRWVHDQGSIDVLRVSDPSQLQSVWNGVRGRMIDLEGNVAAFAAGVSSAQLNQSLNYLSQSIAGLRGALESNVALRLDPNSTGQDALLQSSTQTVYDRRRQLEAAIGQVQMGVR